MQSLLSFSVDTAIDSVVEQHVTPRPAAAGVQQAQAAGQNPSPVVRRHKRSNTFPDSTSLAADFSVPYPRVLPPSPAAAARAASPGAAAAGANAAAPLTINTTDVEACSTGPGSPLLSPMPQPAAAGDAGQYQPGDQPSEQQRLWHYNPAFRPSSDLDEQQQQLLVQSSEPQVLNRSNSTPQSPFEAATAMQVVELQLKSKQPTTTTSSGTGSPMIGSSFAGGVLVQADAEAAAGAASAALPSPSGSASDAHSSRPTSSSGGTIAQRRSLNIPPLAQAPAAVRQDTWRSTLSPVPSASYDTPGGLGNQGFATAASATPAFGRRSSAGTELGLAPATSAPGTFAWTPASRVSGFVAPLLSVRQDRLRMSDTTASSSAEDSGEDSSGEEDEDMRVSSPRRAQAAAVPGTSFRRRPGASMRQIARSVRRMGGERSDRPRK